MKFMKWSKDGGPESKVWAFSIIEIKSLFSIVVLKFEPGSRDAYHSHAFNAVSWLLSGYLVEYLNHTNDVIPHKPSLKPILTWYDTFHMVVSVGTSWVISLRGPWKDVWLEHTKDQGTKLLTHRRKEIYINNNVPKFEK
jgi:hypothetical protein